MAERRKKQDLTPDELAPAADERTDSLTIVGVLGESTDADSVRLFLDAQFQTYYEIPREAVVRRTRVPAERSPLGVDCSAVVVRRGTELAVHRAETRRVEEEFLAGDFTAPGTFTPAYQAVPAAAGGQPFSNIALCNSDAITCEPTGTWCKTVDPQCPASLDALCAAQNVPFSNIALCNSNAITCEPTGAWCNTHDTRCMPTRDVQCVTRDPRCLITRAPSLCCWSQTFGCPSAVNCPSDFGCPSDLICDPFGGGFGPSGR